MGSYGLVKPETSQIHPNVLGFITSRQETGFMIYLKVHYRRSKGLQHQEIEMIRVISHEDICATNFTHPDLEHNSLEV